MVSVCVRSVSPQAANSTDSSTPPAEELELNITEAPMNGL